VIKAVALGVICLAGVGAIATAAKKPIPSSAPDVAMPVMVGNKADRLPVHTNQKMIASADAADVVLVPTSDKDEVSPPQSTPKEPARPETADIAPRYPHASHERKAKMVKHARPIARHAKKQLAEASRKPLSEITEECRSDGLQPLLAKLNLPCITVRR
jgi:hypothetical protein